MLPGRRENITFVVWNKTVVDEIIINIILITTTIQEGNRRRRKIRVLTRCTVTCRSTSRGVWGLVWGANSNGGSDTEVAKKLTEWILISPHILIVNNIFVWIPYFHIIIREYHILNLRVWSTFFFFFFFWYRVHQYHHPLPLPPPRLKAIPSEQIQKHSFLLFR